MPINNRSTDNCVIHMGKEFINMAEKRVINKNGQLITPAKNPFQTISQNQSGSFQKDNPTLRVNK